MNRSMDISLPVLRSFLAVAERRSFTAAALRLGVGQSTVSQQIRRLEETVGRQLIIRDTHHVKLTSDGDAMVGFARQSLNAHERIEDFFSGKVGRTRLRLGISQDFAMTGLDRILMRFREIRPEVEIELTVAISGYLYQRYDAGDIDVIFVKRKPGDKRGRVAWREQTVWIARNGFHLAKGEAVPLVVYQPPSITRSLAIEALEIERMPWRIACSSSGFTGLRAALEAGLGIAPHSKRLLPTGLSEVDRSAGLPELPEIEFVALDPGKTHAIARNMADMLVDSSNEFQGLGG